jgi:methylenetetrahydrofolate reductase (NADPH)
LLTEGDLITNTKGDAINAVTWGIFPGREVIQPTVMDGQALREWKKEAFEKWRLWKNVFSTVAVDRDHSNVHSLLTSIEKNWYLIQIVDNDYKSRGDIYELIEKVYDLQ